MCKNVLTVAQCLFHKTYENSVPDYDIKGIKDTVELIQKLINLF